MSLQITVTIHGSKEVQRKLDRLGARLLDLSWSMDKIGSSLASYYANYGILSQGGVFNNKWVRLNQQYAFRKAMRYPGRPPMIASGKLAKSFTSKSTSNSVMVTNEASHFKYHQSTRSRTRLPRRQMMGVNDPVRKIVRDLINDDVSRIVRSM